MSHYVIVGAGSAGCVLANRLSADPNSTVTLLEAGGPDDRREVRIPAAFGKLFKGPCDWAYVTEPEPNLGGRRLYWPRGKMLGGSSSMNSMLYIRGNRRDYDRWRDLGNPGWGYDDVLPYFKRAEHQERGASAGHGVGGPLNVADPRAPNPLSRAFVEAAVQTGIPRNADFNGPEQDGAGLFQVTQKGGRRWSAADAYLRPVLGRSNLDVRIGAHATRVLIQGGRATGVEYIREGTRQEVSAEREVILCGGAIGSPQLLMLSGIGPADHLRSLGIEPALELPGVGANLQDHPAVGVCYECTEPFSLASAEKFANVLVYLLLKRGPLTSSVAEACAFVRTRPDLEVPDIQFHFAPVYYLEHGLQNPPGHGFTIGPTLITPRSTGWITLRSRNPLEPPVIQANYLADAADLLSLVEGVKLARQIASAPAFDPYRGREIRPGPKTRDDEQTAAFVRETLETLYHPAGTCRMGSDALAVVDAELRARGIDGLRVVDASIMPLVVSGNTNAPTIMIAEKAADLINGNEISSPTTSRSGAES